MIRRALIALVVLTIVPPAIAAARGYLGVAFASLPPTRVNPLTGEARMQTGVLVANVLAGSAAQRAGLKPGEIVTRINGVAVASPQSAVDAVAHHGAGERLSVTVIDTSRGFIQQNLIITLAANPPTGFLATAGNNFASPPRAAPTRGAGAGPAAPVLLRPLRAGYCAAMAPPGWRVTDANKEASAFTVASSSGALRASYGIVGINSGQAAGYYGPQFRSPAAFAQFMGGAVFGGQAVAQPPRLMAYGFQLITWETRNGYSGFSIYKVYPLPSDPRGYIVSMYIGGAPSTQAKRLAPLAVGVATTIRCNTQLRPPPPNDFHPARGATCFGGECRESDAAGSDFNSILGTGYVHDSAGNNFYVGDENWIENGRDGPGYYKTNGNDVTKLTPGLQ